ESDAPWPRASIRKSRFTSPSRPRSSTGLRSERTTIEEPGWLATAIPCRRAAAARRRLAGGQRGGFVPGMTLFSTETLRASRTFRAEATASFIRPSRPAEGKAPVAELGRGIAAAGAWGLGRAGATGMGLTAANDPVGLAGAGRAGAG